MRGPMSLLSILLLLSLPMASQAESSLPFMKDLAGDAELPRPWGIGLDFFTMDQDYDIDNLEFALPGVIVGDVEHDGNLGNRGADPTAENGRSLRS